MEALYLKTHRSLNFLGEGWQKLWFFCTDKHSGRTLNASARLHLRQFIKFSVLEISEKVGKNYGFFVLINIQVERSMRLLDCI
jgi:hypothetical protein